MEYEVLLTESGIRRISRLMNCRVWRFRKDHDIFRCYICGKQIRIGTIAVHIGHWRYIHKSCYPRFRVDVTEEPTEEEVENFFAQKKRK